MTVTTRPACAGVAEGRRPGARGALRGCWGGGAPLIASRRYSRCRGTSTKRAAQAPGRRPSATLAPAFIWGRRAT